MPTKSNAPPTTILPIAAIRVSRRRRRDFGDLNSLAGSIADLGLLQPLVVTPDHRLVAGERRLRAVRQFGWETVAVHVVHGLDDALRLLQAECDENTQRLAFATSEAVALGRRLENSNKWRPDSGSRKAAAVAASSRGEGGRKPAAAIARASVTHDLSENSVFPAVSALR
jgi:ParB-like chromosome segregation protein Spo0J